MPTTVKFKASQKEISKGDQLISESAGWLDTFNFRIRSLNMAMLRPPLPRQTTLETVFTRWFLMLQVSSQFHA